MTEQEEERCPEWWAPGLKYGVFHHCVKKAKHGQAHRNEANDLSWTGKMNDNERKLIPTEGNA